jgi:uncharacterized protein
MARSYEIKPFQGPPEPTLDWEEVAPYIGKLTPPRAPLDEVTASDIRHWCEVMQDPNPLYRDTPYARASDTGGMIAPPAMVQTWSMMGMGASMDQYRRAVLENPDDPHHKVNAALERAGYTGVVATAQEQTYLNPIRPGDTVTYSMGVVHLTKEDSYTRQGVGRYYVLYYRFTNQRQEEVANMTFRVLWYKPPMSTRRLYKG